MLGFVFGGGVGCGLSLVWILGVGVMCIWVFLCLGMDLVDVFDGMVGGIGCVRFCKKWSVGYKIWFNLVLWWEFCVSGWGGGSIGMLVMWFIGMFLVF